MYCGWEEVGEGRQGRVGEEEGQVRDWPAWYLIAITSNLLLYINMKRYKSHHHPRSYSPGVIVTIIPGVIVTIIPGVIVTIIPGVIVTIIPGVIAQEL